MAGMDFSTDEGTNMEPKIKEGVATVVQVLYDKEGTVQPSRLVEKARPKNSPAHAGFTWDKDKASYEFNLIEARRWIRVVEIVPSDSKPKERLVHVPTITGGNQTREGDYKPMSVVCEQPDEFERARQEVAAKIGSLLQSLRELDRVAQARGDKDMTAILSQLSRGIDMVEKAVLTMH